MDLADDKEKLKHSWLYEAEAEFKQVYICTELKALVRFKADE